MLKSIRSYYFLFFIIFLSACSNSDKPAFPRAQLEKEKWNWGNESGQSESAGYAQVVKVGATLYISGVPTSELNAKGVRQVYTALGDCLEAYGASFKNVVKETLYTTDIDSIKRLNEVRKAFYAGDYPAATWVQIDRLYEPTAKLEVDLVAQLEIAE